MPLALQNVPPKLSKAPPQLLRASGSMPVLECLRYCQYPSRCQIYCNLDRYLVRLHKPKARMYIHTDIPGPTPPNTEAACLNWELIHREDT